MSKKIIISVVLLILLGAGAYLFLKQSNTTTTPHPIHTDDPDLNVGTVKPGESMTFTVTKTGEYGYHNHLNPSDKGRITVE